VAVAENDSYSPVVQTVNALHEASELSVGAIVWYPVAPHEVTGLQAVLKSATVGMLLAPITMKPSSLKVPEGQISHSPPK
jgi:hypothetical protein